MSIRYTGKLYNMDKQQHSTCNTQQAFMETQRKTMAKTDSPELERKERGKFVSLNKQEAQLVLETYIKRSFSNRETHRTVGKREKKHARVQRSVSDLIKFKHRAMENKKPLLTKAELQEPKKKDDVDDTNKPSESEETVQQSHQSTSMARVKSAKKSWFRNLLNQLFRKEESSTEQPSSVVSSVIPENKGHFRKNSIKKNSFRRALSFKKNATEGETKLKRPTYLPLKHSHKPSSVKRREKHGDHYYHHMSEEIELLVNDTDCTRKQSLGEELSKGETKETDYVIKQIVSILQKEGDAYNRKIKEDPTLSNFFRNISYNSFKQLADVYIDKELKNRSSDDTPEDMKFAFSIHFTKQVAGMATHPVNRIMGFGNQYLQDTFTWLSHSTDNLNNAVDSEICISPD